MSEQVRAHVIIFGKVQGVFFRAETQKAANRLRVVGWVKNRDDGTVEALLEGARESVMALIDWCEQGSPLSRVDRVKIDLEAPSGTFTRFDVTY